jgi:ketosteroid isomerase-like protein
VILRQSYPDLSDQTRFSRGLLAQPAVAPRAGSAHTRAISEENVATLRRLYGFFRSRDYTLIEDAVEPDAVIDVSRNIFNPDVHEGLDGLRRFLAQIDDMWIDFAATPEEFIDGGDTVVAGHRISGVGRESGVATDMRLFVVVTFREGKILRFTGGFRSREEALEAAGMSE